MSKTLASYTIIPIQDVLLKAYAGSTIIDRTKGLKQEKIVPVHFQKSFKL